jgi:hypothetical protein
MMHLGSSGQAIDWREDLRRRLKDIRAREKANKGKVHDHDLAKAKRALLKEWKQRGGNGG